jgi:hypothetical protein
MASQSLYVATDVIEKVKNARAEKAMTDTYRSDAA